MSKEQSLQPGRLAQGETKVRLRSGHMSEALPGFHCCVKTLRTQAERRSDFLRTKFEETIRTTKNRIQSQTQRSGEARAGSQKQRGSSRAARHRGRERRGPNRTVTEDKSGGVRGRCSFHGSRLSGLQRHLGGPPAPSTVGPHLGLAAGGVGEETWRPPGRREGQKGMRWSSSDIAQVSGRQRKSSCEVV